MSSPAENATKRNTPLPRILLVFGTSWHIYPCNAHTKVKLPTSLRTTCSYIYTIPYIPFKNHLAISYACILPIYYLHAIYLLSMGYLHKTYILSKCYVETIYRSIYIYTIYMLPICFLYSILYVYYLSCICTFFFCIFNIYIYIYQKKIYIYQIYIHTLYSIYLRIPSIVYYLVSI